MANVRESEGFSLRQLAMNSPSEHIYEWKTDRHVNVTSAVIQKWTTNDE